MNALSNLRMNSIFFLVLAIPFLLSACGDSDENPGLTDGDDSVPTDGDAELNQEEDQEITCLPGFILDPILQICVLNPDGDAVMDGPSEEDADLETIEEDTDEFPEIDLDDALMEGDPEEGTYGEYDEPTMFQTPEGYFSEVCKGSTPQYSEDFEIAYDAGTVRGFLGGYAFNDEALHFIATAPLWVKKVRLVFSGPGQVAVRLTRDVARSNPDLDQLLAPEKIITVTEEQKYQWVEVDFTEDQVRIHPRDHFWVVYRHLSRQPMLCVGDATSPESRSMYRSDEMIEEWRAEGSAFVWGGMQDDDNYMVRVIGSTFCPWTDFYFTDRSAETIVHDWWTPPDGDEEPEIEEESSAETEKLNAVGQPGRAKGMDGDVEPEEELEEATETEAEVEISVDSEPVEEEMEMSGDADPDDPAEIDSEPEADAEAEIVHSFENMVYTGSLTSVDLNNDGWQDLVFHHHINAAHQMKVLLNKGDGTFTDYTGESGLSGYWTVFTLFGDLNNDGYLDAYGGIYTNQDSDYTGGENDKVLLNDGAGHFSPLPDDVSGVAYNLDGERYADTTSAAGFADFDHDGILDLYIGNWLKKYPEPAAMRDVLFKGTGDGTFLDSSVAYGITYRAQGYGRACYGATWCDWNDDGFMDILVANYGYGANFLWKNNAGASFEDVGEETHLAFDELGYSTGGNTFAIDCGDYNNDGYLDVYLAEIAHPRYQPQSDPSRLMRNSGPEGEFVFEDMTHELGIYYDEGEISPTWIDYDNDGDLDLFVVTLYPVHWARLYRNDGNVFTDITYQAGINAHYSVRAVWADFNRDGDLDLLVSSAGTNGHLRMYENTLGNQNHWAEFKLTGVTSNRFAIGAKVTLHVGEKIMVREVRGGLGHFNQQPPFDLHFGLGDEEVIDQMVIRWPNGNEQTINGPISADHFYSLSEGGTLVTETIRKP